MPLSCPVDDFSLEIWERIAYYAVESDASFLGPPSALCSLIILSRKTYRKLSWTQNFQLYARIFGLKFDLAAATRRLTERWLTARCLTFELVKRFEALSRIRTKQYCTDDLWTVYLMMLEGDGKNEAQLLQYAGLRVYLESLVMFRLKSRENSWFSDRNADSLTMWLLWLANDRDDVRKESFVYRDCLISLMHSAISVGYRHPSLFAPDVYFTLPLCDAVTPQPSLGALSPPMSDIVHYSHPLRISVPVISSAVILALTVRAEAFQNESNAPNNVHLPLNRAAALAMQHHGPTVEDIFYFHFHNRIPLRSLQLAPEKRCGTPFDVDDVVDETFSNGASERHDEDWYRLVSCYDPCIRGIPLRGVIFRPGSLAGSWEGRLMIISYELHTSLLNNQSNTSTTSLRHNPLYWILQEHHCLEPNEPLLSGLDEQGFEDILHAWLPREARFEQLEDAVEVYDPNTGRTSRYDTFLPGHAAPYSKAAHEKLQRRWISGSADEEIAEKPLEPTVELENPDSYRPSDSYIDDDDEYSDTVSYYSSGVSDILITGKTGESPGEAWGHFTIRGRVRPWDGLIVLLRFPTDPQATHLGTWIFKGYLHDQNLVGRWRETSTPRDFVGYEGGFVVYKNDPVESS